MAEEKLITAAEHQAALRVAANSFIERIQMMRQAGITFDGLRDLYQVLGYARIITAKDYRDRYARGGLAGRVVDIFPNATWRGGGEIIEDDDPQKETELEKGFRELNERLGLWPACLRADKQASIGGFSVILLGAPGELNTELPRGSANSLKFVMPFMGGVLNNVRGATDTTGADATVQEYDTNTQSPRFGQPQTYQLKRANFTTPGMQVPVHWSRIIHIPAEGFLDDAVYGPPRLERVWNHLDELDKVGGGGAEAFWMRANAGTLVNIDKDMKIAPGDDTLTKLQEQADAYAHQMTRMIRGRGVNVETLSSEVADFKGPIDALTTLIAGSIGCPKRLLLGSEMGELASTQDRENWQDQVNDRRSSYALPMILRPLIVRLQEYGYLASGAQAWKPGWASVINLSETEKAAGAKSWADINKILIDAGLEPAFTSDEIRDVWYGFDPLPDDERRNLRTVDKVTHLSVNEKRELTGFDEYTGDPDVDSPADVPLDLIPKVVPPHLGAAPGEGEPPVDAPGNVRPLGVAATARRLEEAMASGGTIQLSFKKPEPATT